jgi:hypothetical protein
MKSTFRITLLTISLVMLSSCDYDTHVLNIVHRDGSVTRRITVENSQEYFEPARLRVPIDSTWNTTVSYTIGPNIDTLWYLTAEKHFRNVGEINHGYKVDKGSNRAMARSAHFTRKFKWFTTEFRYSENVERALEVNCPMSDYLTEEEMSFINLPTGIQVDLRNGPDSTRYNAMNDRIENKLGEWFYTCEMRQWIDIFQELYGNDPRMEISRKSMQSKESLLVDYLMGNEEVFERLFEESVTPDSLFIHILGEKFYQTFSEEIAHSFLILREMSQPVWFSDKYELEIRMPGRILASSGYAKTDSEEGSGAGILFTVAPEHFLTENLDCWVVSRVNNYFIWIVTGLFILIVVTGTVRRPLKRIK